MSKEPKREQVPHQMDDEDYLCAMQIYNLLKSTPSCPEKEQLRTRLPAYVLERKFEIVDQLKAVETAVRPIYSNPGAAYLGAAYPGAAYPGAAYLGAAYPGSACNLVGQAQPYTRLLSASGQSGVQVSVPGKEPDLMRPASGHGLRLMADLTDPGQPTMAQANFNLISALNEANKAIYNPSGANSSS